MINHWYNGGPNLSIVILIIYSILCQHVKTITSVKLHVAYMNVSKTKMEEITSRTCSNATLSAQTQH